MKSLQWMVALSLWKVVCCRDFVTPMDGRLFIMEGSLLSRFLLLHWMVALSLWKVVYFEIFVILMDCILVIMEGSLLSRFLLLQWMVALSLWKEVGCRDFCYYNGL